MMNEEFSVKKLLFFAIYPAPYRAVLAKALASEYQVDLFYSSCGGDDRAAEWFARGEYHALDTQEGKTFFAQCKKKIKQYDLVVVMDFSGKEPVRLLSLCRRKKVPYLVNCDGVMLFRHGNFLRDWIKTYLLGKASAYLASGAHAKQYFLQYGADENKIRFHPFTSIYESDLLSAPLSPDEKAALRKNLGLPQGKLCIAVGRYIPLKRYDVLLNLWKQMPPDVHLLLIGGGPEKERYQAILAESGLQNVILEDFHPFGELMEYYRAADLFLHPTSYDVWGLVVNEAMANGLPVVVSDTCVAGLELIQNGKNGYVVHLGEDEEFLQKAKSILVDDDLRASMAESAIETIRNYTVEKMVQSQMKTVREVLSGE
ncbi:MAG: glycosyltransferase family 4 protein [Ruminococcaceae bacterium]|nr:glycosyltransferase family 4 protein [Oscillospiraceae bacterium]